MATTRKRTSSSTNGSKAKKGRSTRTKPSEVREDTAAVPSPPTGPAPRGLNDVRGDSAPVLGHSVEVTAGEHQGTFGTFEQLEGDQAVVQPRSAPQSRVTVPVADLRPADPYRR